MIASLDRGGKSVSRINILHQTLPQTIAGAFAILGTYSCVFLLPRLSPWALFLTPFGLGYLTTAGYLLRTFTVPAMGTRYLIWGTSIAFHGVWLCWNLWIAMQHAASGGQLKASALLWGGFATAASVLALVFEKREVPASHSIAAVANTSNLS